MRKYVTAFLVWLALVVVSAIITILSIGVFKYYRLAHGGITVQGQVKSKEPDNHYFIRYVYWAGNQMYEGEGSAGYGNPSFRNISVGQPILVVYDPTDPRSSCLGDPNPRFQQTLWGVGFVAILFPTFAVIALFSKGFLRARSNAGLKVYPKPQG